MQAKLPRVLQERELDRIGGKAPLRVDVRVIAATNRNLAAAVRDKEFREDLFYRLNVFPIQLPPLRERTGDVPLLAYYFASRFAMQLGRQLDGITSATIERLVAYPWPGNIRELENVIERAVILCQDRQLDIDPMILQGSPSLARPDVGSTTSATPDVAAGIGTLESVERAHIAAVLARTSWRIDGERGAAQILGLHPNTLRSRMKRLGLARPQ